MGDKLCPDVDNLGQALLGISAGTVGRVKPGKGLAHAVKTKP